MTAMQHAGLPNGPHAMVSLCPKWLPGSVQAYLAHTVCGVPVRALARRAKCHPSTISRQITRWEEMRDICLVDDALSRVSGFVSSRLARRVSEKDETHMTATFSETPDILDDETFTQEARRILRRLSESGAVLALASDMEKGVVVRETEAGTSMRTAVVDRTLAQAFALKDWIACVVEGRVSRYRITPQGRAAVGQMLAEAENRAGGFAEAPCGFDFSNAPRHTQDQRRRRAHCETPLINLSRRREKDGSFFLQPNLIAAGERLREDFELAQIGQDIRLDWNQVIKGDMPKFDTKIEPLSSEAALMRASSALQKLGPGLGDVALRCCCLLDGLEATERALGWSARSGKIVLRIALEHLAEHYAKMGRDSQLIG